MEQQDSPTGTATTPPPIPPQELVTLRERLAKCETALHYERMATMNGYASLEARLNTLSREMWAMGAAAPLGWSGWMKVGLSAVLFFLTYLITGDPHKAFMVSKQIP
jgi:hypothetical protein